MKRRDLHKEVKKYGWWEIDGSKHEKWTNGVDCQPIPRHVEINKHTAKSILDFVKANPGPKEVGPKKVESKKKTKG